MIKLKEILKLPPDLYHATFKALIPSIKKNGIIPSGKKFQNFTDIEKGVYLSDDYGFAGSMIENSENPNIPDKWFNEIVIIKIDPQKLDSRLLYNDPNINFPSENENVHSYIYKGTIPPTAIIGITKFT